MRTRAVTTRSPRTSPRGAARTMKTRSSPVRGRKKPAADAAPEAPFGRARASFPIVGIGASAGGLEALEQFLGHVPSGSGMAFVVVQHQLITSVGVIFPDHFQFF